MRITVLDIPGWLAHGMSEKEILEEHPGLEKEDFAAVYAFAAEMAEGLHAAVSIRAFSGVGRSLTAAA